MNPRTVADFELSQLKWRGASDTEIQSVIAGSRRRGGERVRSERGFGYSRKRNEVLPGQIAVRDNWFYDQFTVAAGAAAPTVNMFATPQGQSGKTLAQTNLTGQGGQLPAGYTLSITDIRIYISNLTVPADFQNILTNYSVEFKVNNSPVYQTTPGFFPAGYGGVTLAGGNLGTLPAGTTSFLSTTNGLPHQTAVYEFKYPYGLESQLNFTVLWTPQTAFNMTAGSGVNPVGVGTTITVTLNGIYQKIVTS